MKSVNSLLSPYRSGKRPISPASYSSTFPTKLPRRTGSLSEELGRNASSAAPLEQLPTELLETIFLHHPNISLPQASPIIGSKLASDYVKSQLVLRFCSAGRPNTNPCEQATLSPIMADQAEAQSALLRVRWMTLTFVRQLIPDYITKILVRELSERGLQWLRNGPVVTKETESTIRQYLENKSVRFAKSNQDDLPVFGNISWRIEDPPRLIRLSFGLHDGLVTIEERRIYGVEEFAQHVRPLSAERDQWRIICGVSGCEVPDTLLHGPWTGERCDFLELVIMEMLRSTGSAPPVARLPRKA